MSVTVRDWVEAMRDGSHTFGRCALRNARDPKDNSAIVEGSHCALGVLCDIAGYETNDEFNEFGFIGPNGEKVHGSYTGAPLHNRLLSLGISPDVIANLNDGSKSFEPVIEFITCGLNVDPDAVLVPDPLKVKLPEATFVEP